MSLIGLGRCSGRNRSIGVHNRQLPIGAHTGTAEDFLRRYERAATTAAQGTKKQRRKFAAEAFRHAADQRNLTAAIDHLVRHGGRTPGPNGLKLERLEQRERIELARALSKALRDGTYQPGATRTIGIPKSSGGTRRIEIPNADDKIVQRALVQALQPLLEPQWDDNVFGFRPGLSREHALTRAEKLSQEEDVWIVEDLADAFGSIPHGRALDIFTMHGFCADMVEILGRVLRANCKRGLAQGGPLSPFWMNAYADHYLDRPWRGKYPNLPLLRWADDLLVLCREGQNPLEVREKLDQLIRPTGMALKGTPEGAVRRIGSGEAADWLGYRITKGSVGLTFRIANESWTALRQGLTQAHEGSAPPLEAAWVACGWLDQLGPCFQHEDAPGVIRDIGRMLRETGFDEGPGANRLMAAWWNAHKRFTRLATAMEHSILGHAAPPASILSSA